MKIAVVASGVSMSVISRNVLMPRGWTFFRTSRIENLTSALVNGWPSCALTSPRSLKVIVLPSGLTVQDSARLGIGLRSKPYSSSPSNTLAVTWPIGPDVLR